MPQETVDQSEPEVATELPAAAEGTEEPNLEILLKDYQEWLTGQSEPRQAILTYDAEDDLWEVELPGQGSLVAYLSEIDGEFYGDGTALFLECELGPPDPQTDFSKLLLFSGQELVLSRISLSERDDGHVLVVEAASPFSQIDFDLLDLMVREVLAIATDVRELV